MKVTEPGTSRKLHFRNIALGSDLGMGVKNLKAEDSEETMRKSQGSETRGQVSGPNQGTWT